MVKILYPVFLKQITVVLFGRVDIIISSPYFLDRRLLMARTSGVFSPKSSVNAVREIDILLSFLLGS